MIVALSGHGKMSALNRFFFMPHDFDATKRHLESTGLSWAELRDHLHPLADSCLVLVVMDTCDSGGATFADYVPRGLIPEEDLKRQIDEAMASFRGTQRGIRVLAASLAGQQALEAGRWGHGALTLALLEGVGQARIYVEACETTLPERTARDAFLTLEHLEEYATRRVREITGGRQKVVVGTSGNMHPHDVPIALFRPAGQGGGR